MVLEHETCKWLIQFCITYGEIDCTSSLNSLISIFSQQFVPDLVLGRKETVRDNIEKLFKRGLSADKELAATLASVTSLQIGAIDIDAATVDFNILKPFLQSLLIDHTAPVAVRIKVSLNILTFGR